MLNGLEKSLETWRSIKRLLHGFRWGVLIKTVAVKWRKKNYVGFGIWRTNAVTDCVWWQEIARTLIRTLFKKKLFLEWKGVEREGGKHQCVVASHTPPTGDLACNPGMCPDREWN